MKKRAPATTSAPGGDRELFRASVADAVPLRSVNRARIAKPSPLPVATQHDRDERAALDDALAGPLDWDDGAETGEELQYLRDGIARDTLRKLRRAHWKIQAELDLHGLTSGEAHVALARFLAESRAAGMRCLRVIHGKGLRSANREPVLKRKVARWLAQRDDVLAYCQARRTDGGSGAVVVLLKSGGKVPVAQIAASSVSPVRMRRT